MNTTYTAFHEHNTIGSTPPSTNQPPTNPPTTNQPPHTQTHTRLCTCLYRATWHQHTPPKPKLATQRKKFSTALYVENFIYEMYKGTDFENLRRSNRLRVSNLLYILTYIGNVLEPLLLRICSSRRSTPHRSTHHHTHTHTHTYTQTHTQTHTRTHTHKHTHTHTHTHIHTHTQK
jgi:hypothetical protein